MRLTGCNMEILWSLFIILNDGFPGTPFLTQLEVIYQQVTMY